jgi:hypothetical protein
MSERNALDLTSSVLENSRVGEMRNRVTLLCIAMARRGHESTSKQWLLSYNTFVKCVNEFMYSSNCDLVMVIECKSLC